MPLDANDDELVRKVFAILLKTPEILYIQIEKRDDPRLVVAYHDEPALYVERFGSLESCERAFKAAELILTHDCHPPCISFDNVIVQPAYAARIARHEEEGAYWAVIQFTLEHNLAYKFFAQKERDEFYGYFLAVFKLEPDWSDTLNTTTKQ